MSEPRWLDASAAAAYVSMTESAFRRRVAAGTFPRPNLSGGQRSPRWDRLALDAVFEGGSRSDIRQAVQAYAEKVRSRKARRQATSRRHDQDLPVPGV